MGLRLAMVLTGVAAALAAAAGAWAPATHDARTTADEPQYLLTAISLAEDGDLDIADELREERWRAFHAADLPPQTRPLEDGREISPHDPLLPLLLAPGVALGGWLGAKLTLAAMAGALAALLVHVAVTRLSVPVPTAALVVTAFACSAPLAPYGTQLYPELPAALAVTIAAAALFSSGSAWMWVLGLAVTALPWLAVKYAPVAAVLGLLGIWRLWREGRPGVLAWFVGGLALAGVAYLGLHQVVWGGWTPYASADHFVDSGEFGVVGFRPDYWGRSRRLLGLLVDNQFGLMAWQPAWVLLVPAVAELAARRPRGWDVLLAPWVVGWLVATFVALTMQGWWFPGRQVVVVLPLVVLAIARWAATGARRLALAVLGVPGVVAYAWLVVEATRGRLTWVVDFMATQDPLGRAWRALLPDYLDVTPATWILHGLWLAVAVTLAAWTLRRPRAPRGS